MQNVFNDNKNKLLGAKGEDAVAKYLEKKGFAIICKNYRKRFGEVDIIVKKKEIICFVEVKTRKKKYFPLSSIIVAKKRKNIIATAKSYLYENKISDKVVRFDVALVQQEKDDLKIEYIENAFTC